jgi:hypothetical protein
MVYAIPPVYDESRSFPENDMQGTLESYRGACHCGAVQFEIRSTLAPARRCNCTLCRRKGAVMATVAPEDFKLLRGEDHLSMYQFNTRTAKHYFCKVCGIYTFHRPRTDPKVYRVNVGCLDGVDPLALEVTVFDGMALSTVAER